MGSTDRFLQVISSRSDSKVCFLVMINHLEVGTEPPQGISYFECFPSSRVLENAVAAAKSYFFFGDIYYIAVIFFCRPGYLRRNVHEKIGVGEPGVKMDPTAHFVNGYENRCGGIQVVV